MSAKSSLKLHKPKRSKSELEALRDIDAMPYDDLEPYYEVVHSGKGSRHQGVGVWYHDVTTVKDEDGNEKQVYRKPLYLSDAFDIIGRGQDADESGYRVLQYKRNGQGRIRTVALPNHIMGTKELWAFLRNLDIGVYQDGKRLNLLTNFVQWQGDRTEYEITKRGGWSNRDCVAYLMQTGDIIGKAAKPIIYTGDKSRRPALVERGSLQEWQNTICRYLAGNSRPLLALGAVFAAPLLSILNIESGGFHFYGSSSIGKSISGIVAFSAMGDPFQLKIQWNGTSLSFENEAAANNDGCLFLDEIHQADIKVVKDVAYSLFNGVSKGQGKKDGGNRVRERWLVTAISTGEFDVARYMEAAGIDWTGGQAVRLPAIPADVGNNSVFETLHDFDSSKALAEHLSHYANEHCGVAFPLFVKHIAACMAENPAAFKERINSLKQEFMTQTPPNLAIQPARVLERFALAAVALELAAQWGITGLEKGVGSAGVLCCFQAWQERDGVGNREEMQIIQAARDLLQRDDYGERFKYLMNTDGLGTGAISSETSRNHAGYRVPR